MRFAYLNIAVLYGSAMVAADCIKDNCLRAVIASAYTTRSGVADCGAYLITTVTPPVSIVTKTINTVSSYTGQSGMEQRKVRRNGEGNILEARATAATIPAYASPCSGAARYTSACSVA
ncbi:hypothetical protein H072_7134 [Dactylellina haptotyla CBS 200.50]|uniref:Uncharacterized protein n=1 Tax=Dactylellina haptotyla (strain CBS 200.50) TaxID=1284197 RepID=S8BIG0_DACHA|nr:hypothetical protein H072_7134 [Dactylellina haptotyla CBS 200.50]